MTISMTARLEYMGRPMRWEPMRILCLQSQGPLDSDEPNDADILGLLADGYSVFVELQPGDGTRYGLFLTAVSGEDDFNVLRVGAPSFGSICVRKWFQPEGKRSELTPLACTLLAPSNEWSRVFFAWWLNALVHDERVAP